MASSWRRGLRNREEGLGRCLVGRWGARSVGESELLEIGGSTVGI